ncbi:MAG: hypothetical protein AABY06_02965 [Nanoarchaeota archaeon]
MTKPKNQNFNKAEFEKQIKISKKDILVKGKRVNFETQIKNYSLSELMYGDKNPQDKYAEVWENFKRAKNIENINRIQEIVYQKRPLNVMRIQMNEELNERSSGIYKEKLDSKNLSKPFYNKVENNLLNYFKKIQEPKYSPQKIKILN